MTIISPDGRQFIVDADPDSFLGPWGFSILVKGSDGDRRVEIGTTGSHDLVSRATGESSLYRVREAQLGGRRLVSYENASYGATIMMLVGSHYELSTTVHGTDVPFEPFMRFLSRLHVVDDAAGITVRARSGTGTKVELTMAANTITEVCSVVVMPLDGVSVSLPRHAGRSVRGGQLWREDPTEASGLDGQTILLANATTTTVMTPFERDDRRMTRLAQSVRFDLV